MFPLQHIPAIRPQLLSLCTWLAAVAASAAARGDEPLAIDIRQVELGYGGIYKSGFVTPLWLTLRPSRDVEGIVEVVSTDGDGVPVTYAAEQQGQRVATALKAGMETTVGIQAKIGPEDAVLSAQLRDRSTGEVVWKEPLPAATPRPAESSAELVVALGDSPAVLEAASLVPRATDHAAIGANVTDPQRVPHTWPGWEGVRTIVVPLGENNLVEKLSRDQLEALIQWVEIGGGRLVICLGVRSREILADDHPLTPLVPGTLVDVVPLRDLDRLSELTGHPLAVTSDSQRPRVGLLAMPRGKVELTVTGQREEVPLLVRTSQGFGEVAALAIDPDGPELADWPGRGRLLLPAIAEQEKFPAAAHAPRRTTRLGYEDLTGQLRMALDHFPQVRVVNVTTVSMLTLAYLALIGPIEFFVVRRFQLPSIVTWFVFPLLAAAFCLVGWYAAGVAHGRVPLSRQCEVIDIDARERLVRGTAWLHVYSPQTRPYEISLTCDRGLFRLAHRPQGWLSWQGLPGKGLGGLAANQLATSALLPYAHHSASGELLLDEVPIQIAGSKALSARWWGKADLADPPTLTTNQFGLLEGEIANPLPVPMHDCLLVFDEWMYRLRTVSPGQRIRVADLDMLNLEARLQQRTVAGAQDVISPWEPDSTDVPRILQMLMFHQSARGSAYTNLSHRYQGYLDLTPRIRSDRAVLVGRLPKAATAVTLDGSPLDAEGDPNPWTFVRILFPVSPPSQPPPREWPARDQNG